MFEKSEVAYELKIVAKLINNIRYQISRDLKFNPEPKLYCPITERMLYIIVNECSKAGGNQTRMSTNHISKVTGTSRHHVRCRLHVLAQYGLVKLIQSWRNDGSGKMKSQLIIVNDKVFYLLDNKPKIRIRNEIIKKFLTLGQSRDESEELVQGFVHHTPIGEEEPEEVSQTKDDIENEMILEIEKKNKEAAEKEKERLRWKQINDRFIRGASELWRYGQMKAGHGDAMPHWAAPINMLSPEGRRERNCLIKKFEFYGGRTTCLAWYMFTCGRPKIDPNTLKPLFDMAIPYRQFVGVDKRPEKFDKYFDSILKDKHFKEFSTISWKKIYAQLKGYFGEVVDTNPRDGEWDIERVGGIVYGEVTPRIEAIQKAADERRKMLREEQSMTTGE